MIINTLHKVNKYKGISEIPYSIIQYLFRNEDIWKLIKYTTPDALSKPNLTPQEKANLVWLGQDRQEDYNVFLTPMQENIQPLQSVILRLYLLQINPRTGHYATMSYAVDVLCESKIGMLENGVSRTDYLLELILGEIIGQEVGGIGEIFFNSEKDANSRSRLNLMTNNSRSYMGYSVAFGVQQSHIE